MAYPEEVLAGHECLVVHKHPHWKTLVLPVGYLVGVVALTSFLAAVARNQSWAYLAWMALGAVAVIAVLGLSVGPALRWRTTHFVLTDRRVLVREGLFTRTGIDIPLSRISSVQFRHGILDRLLGTGTLIIESASEEPLEFNDVPQVERVHALLYDEVFGTAQRGGAGFPAEFGDRDEDQPERNPPATRRGRGWRGGG